MNVSPFRMIARFVPNKGLALGIPCCLAWFLLLSATTFSQSNTGRILGTVHDQQDAAIVGAQVVITDVQRGVSRTLATDVFNVLNHPNFANPYGGQNGLGLNDPSVSPFGCGCVTPDVAAANPIIGSGGARAVQLGLKLAF
jgi:hypothetical protein